MALAYHVLLCLLLALASRVGAFSRVPALQNGRSQRTAVLPGLNAITPDGSSKNMEDFRRALIQQNRPEKREEFDGYALCDIIVEKWGVPYDIQIKKDVFAGKPMVYFNVMWKYLGQQSFHLTEREYLEHLEALAQLLVKWDRVSHFKQLVKESRKKPIPYFGYAVALPLELPPDTLTPYFEEFYR